MKYKIIKGDYIGKIVEAEAVYDEYVDLGNYGNFPHSMVEKVIEVEKVEADRNYVLFSGSIIGLYETLAEAEENAKQYLLNNPLEFIIVTKIIKIFKNDFTLVEKEVK